MTTKLQLQLQHLQCLFRKLQTATAALVTCSCSFYCKTAFLGKLQTATATLVICSCIFYCKTATAAPLKGGRCSLQLFVIGGKWALALPTLHHNFTTGTFAREKKN